MSAQTAGRSTALTPTEQAEVTRFNIHESEVIEHMERFSDYPLECSLPRCVKGAEWRLSMRCCGAAVHLCGHHAGRAIVRMRRKLRKPGPPECITCSAVFPVGSTFEDIVWVSLI